MQKKGLMIIILVVAAALWVSTGCQKSLETQGKMGDVQPDQGNVRVMIEPGHPYTSDDLKAVIENQPSSFNFKWIVNGKTLQVDNETLSSHYFVKGDRIKAEVSNPETGGTFSSSEVMISNSPPRVKTIGIRVEAQKDGYALRAMVDNSDADDETVTNHYTWLVNGKAIEGENSDRIVNNNFERGNMVSVKVIPDDGIAQGLERTSPPLKIPNTPPAIFSQIPELFVENGDYTYQVLAVDRDRDRVRFELQKAPVGMRIDPVTGILVWKSEHVLSGLHTIDIAASDGTNSGHQVFTLTVN